VAVGGAQLVTSGLLERGAELEHIRQAIAALARGHGGVLIIEGAAGIGKSALLHALIADAEDRNVQTLTARASELEREFGFGVVRQLLEARIVRAGKPERAELLAGAAGLAGPVLGLGGTAGSSFAALHGLYWLVANVAAGGPVVLAVDDLHWADEPSLRWLLFLCQRLEGLPVLVAASTRPPRPAHPHLLAELLTVNGIQVLSPGPLSEAAVAQLITERLGAAPDPAFIAACAAVTGGNPFVLRELLFDLAAAGLQPDAAQAVSLAERVPAQVERAVLARLGRLNPAAVGLVQAVAVLGEDTELKLAAALAKLDLDTAAAAADVLLAAELVAEHRPLRFVHPLVRSAIYEQLPPGARAQAHAQAAQLLMRHGAGHERVAAQLLLCEPAGEADAVRALRAAAAAALARGAPEIAVTYLRRALAEPPAESVHAEVVSELGGAECIARHPAAVVHLEQARQATTDPIRRARLADQLANVLVYVPDLARSAAVLQAALEDLGDRDVDLAARLDAHKAFVDLLSVYPTEVPEVTIGRLRELATAHLPASRSAQLILATFLAFRGESCHEVAGLIAQGWDGGRFLAEETSETFPTAAATFPLVYIDDLDGADALAEATMADAQARGSIHGLVAGTGRRGLVALRRGQLAGAEADLRAVLELVTAHNLTNTIPYYAAFLGIALLERGELDQAADVVDGVTLGPTMMPTRTTTALWEARGQVRLACGQRPEAIEDLRRCGQLSDQAGWRNPNLFAWRSTLALALAPEQPHEAAALAQEELTLARRAGSRRAIGIALRVCGLLAGEHEGSELLKQSVAVLEPTQMRLELARSLTEWGAALRRAGARVAAREPLRRALDLAARCGAAPLAERAREESLAAGARPRRPWSTGVHALTPSELRVARLAAQAMGNREIAQALFITTKTVSDHLSSAYRKLNISSRDELAPVMAAHAN
jgi:DNA-binding CsgD family transcriptional regulator